MVAELRGPEQKVSVEMGAKTSEPIPAEVEIREQAPRPKTDSTLGIEVAAAPAHGTPRNRLVVLGDSLSNGFQSGAVFHTDLSYPALIARQLGIEDFRFPRYPGFGGIPFNIEFLLADLEHRFGAEISPWETPLAIFRIRQHLAEAEAWWDGGPGSRTPPGTAINHNLAVYGWDLRDTLERTAETSEAELRPPEWQALPLIRNATQIGAIRALASARDGSGKALTPLGAAAALGAEGAAEGPATDGDPGDGIETLIVMLGANNALDSVMKLAVHWSDDGYDDLEQKVRFNVWRPSHFKAELDRVVAEVEKVRARHVIWGTVPHVTIAPIARGVGGKVKPGSRYFKYYTRPWIAESDFDPAEDGPYLSAEEARAVDSAIDQYNEAIAAAVAAARRAGRDWRLVDICGVLDRLASRRYLEDPEVRKPDWWDDFPSPLPERLAAMQPPPDTRFLATTGGARSAGGLVSLDGIHPTTIGYGVMASEFMAAMADAGVEIPGGAIDFERLIGEDALISKPPASLTPDLELIGWIDQRIDVISRLWTGL